MTTKRFLPLTHASAFLVWGLLASAFITTADAASRVRVNLGTLAPRGSLYHKSLQTMGEEWRKTTDGNVRLVIFPDGTQGGEADMVRLMRIGTLQAGLFTAVGLTDIEAGVAGLQTLPMMFRSLDEFEYVNERLRPTLEKRLADKGFVVLFWADAGWVRYFSKNPIRTPDDLRKTKVFVWAGSTKQVDLMKSSGYSPVPLETSDILTGLQTGLIGALSAPPIYALAYQIDLPAPHMLELNWAPLVGGAIIKKDDWERIPESQRTELLAIARRIGKEVQDQSRLENEEAVKAMQKRGLQVHLVSPEIENLWRTETEKFYPQIRGSLVPADIFDDVVKLLKEYRSGARPPKP